MSTLLVTAACGGNPVAPEPGPPASMQRVRGDLQTADPADELPRRLTVRVSDSAGVPVPDVSVVWSVRGGGEPDPATVITDGGGKASTRVRLSRDEGDRVVTAIVQGNPNVGTSFLVFVTPAPGGTGGVPDAIVEVGDAYFDPPLITVERGQIVEWRWVGDDPHNVVFMDTTITPRNSVGVTTVRTSGSWQHRFGEPGIFDYGCLVHGFPAQNGRVIVN